MKPPPVFFKSVEDTVIIMTFNVKKSLSLVIHYRRTTDKNQMTPGRGVRGGGGAVRAVVLTDISARANTCFRLHHTDTKLCRYPT